MMNFRDDLETCLLNAPSEIGRDDLETCLLNAPSEISRVVDRLGFYLDAQVLAGANCPCVRPCAEV